MRMPKKSGKVSQVLSIVARKTVKMPKLPQITRDTPNLLLVLDKLRRKRLSMGNL